MDKDLNVRVSDEQLRLFKRAGEHYRRSEGSGTYSDWVRRVLTKAARKQLGEDDGG